MPYFFVSFGVGMPAEKTTVIVYAKTNHAINQFYKHTMCYRCFRSGKSVYNRLFL